MSSFQTELTEDLLDYMQRVSLREAPVLAELRALTSQREDARMLTSPVQGQFLYFLCLLTGAKKVLEVGTFTGYGSAWMAMALPVDGRVVTCDVDEEPTTLARTFWERAGLEERIDLRMGPAADTLEALRQSGEENSFDLVYIDADKRSYPVYFEHALALLRPGGVVAVDNVLWGGRVIGEDDSPDTQAIRAFNAALRDDARVDISMLPLGDGLFLARRR